MTKEAKQVKAKPASVSVEKTVAPVLALVAPSHNPTEQTYKALDQAYAHFNRTIFSGSLPACLITIQRKSKAYGFFCSGRFAQTQDHAVKADEIALNPSHFINRTAEETLSTLVHEMAHLWQHHQGKPSKSHHNKQWAEKMKAIGLYPSSTGAPGGKETGQKVSHYILPGKVFAVACAELLAAGFVLPYVEIVIDQAAAKKKAASKTKYTCPDCKINAWAKPDVKLACFMCSQETDELVCMVAEENGGNDND